MADNFFAMLDDCSVRRIGLLQNIENSIRDSFMKYGPGIVEEKEQIEFNGNYKIDEDEVLYVKMKLPAAFQDIENNPIQIPELDIKNNRIKALIWYENGVYYFQNFDDRKMLRHRNVLFFNNQTFDKLTSDAFIVENRVNAVFKHDRYYFQSYPNANKIFSLSEYYEAATNKELITFGEHENVSISDPERFLEANTVIRKHVSLLQKSAVLDNADTKKIKKSAKKFKLEVHLNDDGKIVFPKDHKACKEILFFLNEHYYEGVITKRQFRTNSTRVVNIPSAN